MRYVAILGIVCLGTASLLSGCGDGEEGTTGGNGGGGGSEASSSSSSSSGGGSGGGMASSSSSSSGGMMVNGCDSATAEDHLADATVNIAVGANGFTFSPACVRVKKDAKITFTGSFAAHPLVGGLAGPPPAPDSSSPIQATNSGMSATFTMTLAGTYPYYCEYHLPNMTGAIFVE